MNTPTNKKDRNTTRSVKLIKNAEGKEPENQVDAEPPADPNKWSTEVRSWVAELRQDRRVESLPAFESLFKDELPESEQAD
ncbi:MAG: hypothetical protein ND895_07310 [Pyrinomonadaceae bacterium]|nr:hypothetical protein [Pyrinomonadaceae bacterium]